MAELFTRLLPILFLSDLTFKSTIERTVHCLPPLRAQQRARDHLPSYWIQIPEAFYPLEGQLTLDCAPLRRPCVIPGGCLWYHFLSINHDAAKDS